MDNTQEESGFDYKSRDWEKSMSKPVCVACLNESRTHQIPGEYEHICGKQPANNASDTQLPAEVEENEYGYVVINAADNDKVVEAQENGCMLEMALFQAGYQKGKSLYATKLHQAEQEIESLTNQLKGHAGVSNENIKLLKQENEKARSLLEKFISRHEGGLLPDRFIYNEIKTFLDGKY